MANETLYPNISDFTNTVWAGAIQYARRNFVMQNYVTVFSDLNGMVERSVTEYLPTKATRGIGETQSLDDTRAEVVRKLLASLTPQESGHQIEISDRRMETDVENIMSDAITEIGYAMGKDVEDAVAAEVKNLRGGIYGSSGSALNPFTIIQAAADLRTNNHTGTVIAVVHPYQYLDIYEDLVYPDGLGDANNPTNAQAMQSYFVGNISNVPIVVSNSIPTVGVTAMVQSIDLTGTPTGGTFKVGFKGWETDALAHDISAANLQTALNALPSIIGDGSGSVTVTGSNPSFAVEFGGSLIGQQPQFYMADNSLTGGTAPAVSVTTDTAGAMDAVGGLFAPDSIALDVRRALRLEPERKPDLRATTLNASQIYATGTWRSYKGIQLRSDATSSQA